LLELFEIEQADQWAETIKDNPVMIDYELKEISELIADPIRRSDMHTAILDYMAKNWEVGTRCYTRTTLPSMAGELAFFPSPLSILVLLMTQFST
jgi:hypothetical protein